MISLFSDPRQFVVTIEVVPPPGNDPSSLLEKLAGLSNLDFKAFSVASNPVAKPRMSAMAFTHLIQKRCGKKAMLHLTVRDHNRLGLQSELWGAHALGIDTVVAVTGDPSLPRLEEPASTVGDLTVFELIKMAEESGLNTGAVLDFHPEYDGGLDHEAERLKQKVDSGCRFVVTQPVYDESTARKIYIATKDLGVPVMMGILPLLSPRHAIFLHDKVAGIAVPEDLRNEMANSDNPVQTGIIQSRQMLEMAESMFSGACVMPPFDRFDILEKIL
ncbi:MAG: methylenetetrahydrofolate reductase [Desulfobacterales bacterium]|nr:methylenetetrahydrofolate reductase [Desulfobacterales bacterium]